MKLTVEQLESAILNEMATGDDFECAEFVKLAEQSPTIQKAVVAAVERPGPSLFIVLYIGFRLAQRLQEGSQDKDLEQWWRENVAQKAKG